MDELALAGRWLRLSYRFGGAAWARPAADRRSSVPILLDTTYLEPLAVLIAAAPCGVRALPVALATHHRTTLEACFPPAATCPDPAEPSPPAANRRRRPLAAAVQVQRFTLRGPAACWWARTTGESMLTSRVTSPTASECCCARASSHAQVPSRCQCISRAWQVCQGPYRAGRSR